MTAVLLPCPRGQLSWLLWVVSGEDIVMGWGRVSSPALIPSELFNHIPLATGSLLLFFLGDLWPAFPSAVAVRVSASSLTLMTVRSALLPSSVYEGWGARREVSLSHPCSCMAGKWGVPINYAMLLKRSIRCSRFLMLITSSLISIVLLSLYSYKMLQKSEV